MAFRFSVIGLGKLGASMAAAIASKGFQVVGFDIAAGAVQAIRQGRAPVWEPGLAEAIAANRSRISATSEVRDAVNASDVTFVVVPTPSEPDGSFSLRHAEAAFAEVGRALRTKNDFHLVVLVSTVLPGSMRSVLIPILERESGKQCGVGFGACYNPAFIALGTIIRDLLSPDFVLIGESDARSGELLARAHAAVIGSSVAIKRMSIENAELSKIALNTFVTTKITFANMLAGLCERLPGGDVDVVADALGMDKRVGRRYLTGGLGYGGPCFPRDNRALGFLAERIGARYDIATATDALNSSISDRIIERFGPALRPGARVAVLGLAYKPDSDCIEASQGMQLALAWADAGAKVIAYDPLASQAARPVLGARVELAGSLREAVVGADVVLITTNDGAFKEISADWFPKRGASTIVVDFWRTHASALEGKAGIEYVPIGRNTDWNGAFEVLRRVWSGKRDVAGAGR